MNEISCLKNQIEILTLKNALYSQLIKKYTNIKIEDFLSDLSSVNELRIVINDMKPVSAKDINKIDELFNKSKPDNIKVSKSRPRVKPKNKVIYKGDDSNTEFIIIDQPEEEFEEKKNYKSLKNFIEFEKESDKKFSKSIPDLEKEILLKEYNEIINEAYNLIGESRVCIKTVNIIKKTHRSIMNITSYNEYFKILNHNIKKFHKVLKHKEYSEKKIETTVINCLNPIDLRILFHPNYIKNGLEIDEIQEFKECVFKSINYPEKYIPFDINFELFFNFGSVLITVKDMLKKYFFNKYGYYNLIYVPIKQSIDTDPYSFY